MSQYLQVLNHQNHVTPSPAALATRHTDSKLRKKVAKPHSKESALPFSFFCVPPSVYVQVDIEVQLSNCSTQSELCNCTKKSNFISSIAKKGSREREKELSSTRRSLARLSLVLTKNINSHDGVLIVCRRRETCFCQSDTQARVLLFLSALSRTPASEKLLRAKFPFRLHYARECCTRAVQWYSARAFPGARSEKNR
jgi:hypothetical protein